VVLGYLCVFIFRMNMYLYTDLNWLPSTHGLNNYKDNMSSLLVFNRVYRLEIQSVTLVFSTGFVDYAPLIFSLVSSPPLSPFSM
jgi:hypothetical protein